MSVEDRLYAAVHDDDVEQVRDLLQSHPRLNINWARTEGLTERGFTALHAACLYGNHLIMTLLLAHPHINVNQRSHTGATPFNLACVNGEVPVVSLLLADPRVNTRTPTLKGHTPLYQATLWGYVDTVKWILASGRPVNLGTPGDKSSDALLAARSRGNTGVVVLLEKFTLEQERTRYELQVELGFRDQLAARFFAVVVFASDGLLAIITGGGPEANSTARFLTIATRLPLELQMVLCYRVVSSTKEIIDGKTCEVAFQDLAQRIMAA